MIVLDSFFPGYSQSGELRVFSAGPSWENLKYVEPQLAVLEVRGKYLHPLDVRGKRRLERDLRSVFAFSRAPQLAGDDAFGLAISHVLPRSTGGAR